MDGSGFNLIAVARAEVSRMRKAVDGADDTRTVKLSVKEFTRLADLLGTVTDTLACRMDTLDDPRYWVPLDHFKKVRSEAEQFKDECGKLKDQQSINDVLRF